MAEMTRWCVLEQTLMSLSEAEQWKLVGMIINPSEEERNRAWAALYERALRLARLRHGDDEYEDFVHDLFASKPDFLLRLTEVDQPRAFFAQSVKYKWLDKIRSTERYRKVLEDVPTDDQGPAGAALSMLGELHDFKVFVDQLEPAERELLGARVAGLTEVELAELFPEAQPNSLGRRIRRLLQRFGEGSKQPGSVSAAARRECGRPEYECA